LNGKHVVEASVPTRADRPQQRQVVVFFRATQVVASASVLIAARRQQIAEGCNEPSGESKIWISVRPWRVQPIGKLDKDNQDVKNLSKNY